MQAELDDWARHGVEGHFRAKNPWFSYHSIFTERLSKIVGAKANEVVAMNTLTVNLHLLMLSFYRPQENRYKILMEAGAFPSDQYAVETQVRMYGYDPADAIIEINPREGEYIIEEEDILKAIDDAGQTLALVMIGGVNYYTGQYFDLKQITDAAHKVGAYAGFDLAHAVGNIPLQLHDWNVDFACWCSYKYLNSGPGAVGGAYIHERHALNTELPRFAGWWGYTKETRFKMEKGFEAIPTVEGWQLSNPPILSMAPHKASLEIFGEAGMNNLVIKSKRLSGYLHFILNDINSRQKEKVIDVITPSNENERGCQVSMLMLKRGKEIFEALLKQGVIDDWREPDVIRVAPTPLYNTFEDIYRFGEIINSAMK
jgi:kynureninase